MQDFSQDLACVPSVILCANELGIRLSVLFSWFIIMFGIVVVIRISDGLWRRFLFICIQAGIRIYKVYRENFSEGWKNCK